MIFVAREMIWDNIISERRTFMKHKRLACILLVMAVCFSVFSLQIKSSSGTLLKEDGMFEELCHLLNVPNEARNEAEYIDIEVNRCAIYGEGQGELLFGEDLLS